MLYALLLLGLIPAVLLPDYLAEGEAEVDAPVDPQEMQEAPGDLLDDLPGTQEAALLPTVEDDVADGMGETDEGLPPLDEDDQQEPVVVVLQPVIEDDQPAPPGGTEEGLAPVVEDDIDQGYTNPDPNEILPPVIEDDVAADDPDGAPLVPVDEIEAGETATWLNASELGAGNYVEMSGFEVGTDVLNITFDPDHGLPGLTVSVQSSEDGNDSEVLVGGSLIAVLMEAADVPVEDIIVAIQSLQ